MAEGHVKGIVHRDIKPGNLFLDQPRRRHAADQGPGFRHRQRRPESDAAESSALTSSDDVRLGSPAYMPPEQLQNPRDVDTRSDIWSLGATLYELLCGRPPFEASRLPGAGDPHAEPPPCRCRSSRCRPRCPAASSKCCRCLEKDRNARYANAAELAAALAPFGSEDARVSLSRVSGIFASSSSFPALTRAISADNTDCDPTLDVAGSGQKREPRTREGAFAPSTPAPAHGRSWLVIAAAAVLVLGVIALRDPLAPTEKATSAPTPSPTPSPSPLPLLAVPAPLAAPLAVLPAETPPPVASEPKRLRQIPRPALPAAMTTPSVTAEPPVMPSAPSTTVPGRSAEIERLIEQRR